MVDHHIVLVGMPCAGKSTIGKLLAQRMGADFVDLDQLMHDTSGKSVPQLLKDLGEHEFLKLEGQTLAVAVKSPAPLVVAPGGSVVLDPQARDILASPSPQNPLPIKVAFLRVPLPVVQQRIQEVGRSLHIVGLGTSNAPLSDQLKAIYKKRKKFYEELSEVTIDLDEDSNPQDAVKELLQKLTANPPAPNPS